MEVNREEIENDILHIVIRYGAVWFESILVKIYLFSCSCHRFVFLFQIDHDVCSNYGNWIYVAGVGNDPRENRHFNMVKQGFDYDPDVI